QFDKAVQRCRGFVGDVQVKSIQTLIGHRDLSSTPTATQIIIGGLGYAKAIDNAPAGSGPKILEKPHQSSRIPGVAASPFGKYLRHYFAGDNLAQLQITRHIEVTELDRIHGEEVLQIEIAHILEVPT